VYARRSRAHPARKRASAPADKNSHAPINRPADIIGIVRHTRHALLSVVYALVISRHYDRLETAINRTRADQGLFPEVVRARSLRSFAEGGKGGGKEIGKKREKGEQEGDTRGASRAIATITTPSRDRAMGNRDRGRSR